MTNPLKAIGDSLLDRLVPTWQAKAYGCTVAKNVNTGACWVTYYNCDTPGGQQYCQWNDCSGHTYTHNYYC
ncbi:MAG: hypothetical protein HOY69_27460 [Streptomyces sp.]|nr:hypothetical protein [Streptomyces sp.]